MSSLKSDVHLDSSKFEEEAVDPEMKNVNERLIELTKSVPRWNEVGAAEYRKMRAGGETAWPAPVILDRAHTIGIPSRDEGRLIPCRVLRPHGKPKAVFVHFHGGGWVLGSENAQDSFLARLADDTGLLVISIGYRLAPENPFPKGPNDCFDAVDWLAENAPHTFGCEAVFLGGESAGAHLAMLTLFEFKQANPDFSFEGLVLNYGCYDLSGLPSAHNSTGTPVIDYALLDSFVDACLPGSSAEQRRDPKVSPFYADMPVFYLPPALFIVGTEDALLHDSVMMATRWMMWRTEAIIKILPGAPHGFLNLGQDELKVVKEAREATNQFLKERLENFLGLAK